MDLKITMSQSRSVNGEGYSVLSRIDSVECINTSVTVPPPEKEMFLCKWPAGDPLEFIDGELQYLKKVSIGPLYYNEVPTGAPIEFAFNRNGFTDSPELPAGYTYITFVYADDVLSWTLRGASVPDITGVIIDADTWTNLVSLDGDIYTGIEVKVASSAFTESFTFTHTFSAFNSMYLKGLWISTNGKEANTLSITYNPAYLPAGAEDSFKALVFSFNTGEVSFIDLSAGIPTEAPVPILDSLGLSSAPSGINIVFPESFIIPEPIGAELTWTVELVPAYAVQESFCNSLEFFRAIAIVDIKGSLDSYSSLSTFYTSYRWVEDTTGVYKLSYLNSDSMEWELFSGILDPSSMHLPFVRTDRCFKAFVLLSGASDFAADLISSLQVFKTKYLEAFNNEFSIAEDPASDEIIYDTIEI